MKINALSVGPIVGVTTETNTRLWGRGAFDLNEAGTRRSFGIARIAKKGDPFGQPTIFKMLPQYDFTGFANFENLSPGETYQYQIGYFFANGEPEDFIGEDDFDWTDASEGQVTTSLNDATAPISFVFGSCRYLLSFLGYSIFDKRGDKIFRSMIQQLDQGLKTDLILMCGDQIYADDLNFLFPDKYLSEYHERYALPFSQPYIRHLMSRIPTYMILDDHEIKNDWRQDLAREFSLLYRNAMHAYHSYQLVHGPAFNPTADSDISDMPQKLWYTFRRGCAKFFVIDTRTERFVDVQPPEMIGQAQMTALKQWLSSSQDTVKFVVSSVPFFPDLRIGPEDKWSGFAAQRNEILDYVRENNVQRVVFLAGDVHCSTSAQLTSSDDPDFRVSSVISSPFYSPFFHGKKSDFITNGILTTSKNIEYRLDNVGDFYSTDNFTRISANLDQLQVQVYGRKGALLGTRMLNF